MRQATYLLYPRAQVKESAPEDTLIVQAGDTELVLYDKITILVEARRWGNSQEYGGKPEDKMLLIPNVLEAGLNALSKTAETNPMSGEEYNKQFASIATKYILTATITTPSGHGTIL